ncbi:uncharacterized protein BJX67DRAFT_215571 [Aspergillus lucknowensis]|uniref:Uncharacterized protein n=1 Tax=Aspergillus lucknowensis TaxID=176173 RepID=A0ABR4M3E1_9EURO
MATSCRDANSTTPSSQQEKDIPQTQPSTTPTSPTLASTATAPSSSTIYATAQPYDTTVLPPSTDLPTTTAAFIPPSTSAPNSPPPPQPGAIPNTKSTTQQELSPPPPAPAPAPKTGITSTLASSQPQCQPLTANPPIISAPPVYPPAPTSTSTSGTSAYSLGGMNQTPRTAGPNSHSYSYPSNYTYPPTPTQQHGQQPQYPNSTTTPYTSVYPLPSASTPAQSPFPRTYGGVDGKVEPDGLWGSAKSWLQTAGNKLAEVEAEVWRRINEAHDK